MTDFKDWSMNDWADFWYYKVGANDLPGSKTKIPKVESWKQFQGKPVDSVLHNHWKKEDKFNEGIMIFAGKVWHNDRNKGLYLIAIDLDNELAIKEFCIVKGEQKTLKQLAESGHFLVEQHPDDQTRAHVYLYSNRPYKKLNRNGDPQVPQIEVKGAGEHGLMCVTNSLHKNGSRYQVLGDPLPFVDQPRVHDEIEKHIDSILSKYNIPYLYESDRSNNNNNTTDGFFKFNPDEKIKEGARHNYLVKYAASLIRRLHKTAPLDVIKNSIEFVNKTHFEEPLPDAEVQQIFKDELEFIRKSVNQEKDQISAFPEIANNIHYQLGRIPPTYIVAFKDTKQVAEVTIKPKSRDKDKGGTAVGPDTLYVFDNTTYLACIPIRIVRHKNPLSFLQTVQKYTMTFIDRVDEKHTFSQKTLAEIVQQLRDLGYVLSDGADKALNALLQAYIQKKFIEDNEETEYIGFFKDNENGIFASNIAIKEPSIGKLSDAIKFLVDELKVHYNGRLDLLATSIVWGMVAPVIYMLKTNNYFLKALHFYGFANATKSNTGKIILALDGHEQDSRFAMQLPSVDTLPKLGAAVSHSTFPILIDEMDLNDPYNAWLINDLKSLIESNLARKKWPNSKASGPVEIPSLSCLILTGNPPPPFHNSGYMRRVIARNFPQSEMWKENDPKAIEFKEFLRVNLPRLKAFGDFRNWWIMNNQNEILDEKRPDPLDLGLLILKSAFEHTAIEIPAWLLEERIPENQLEESMQDNDVIVKRAFEKYIDEQFNRAIQFWRQDLGKDDKLLLPNDITDRLVKLADDNLLPDIKWAPRRFGVIIRAGILSELYRHGVTRDQVPNLKALADYLDADYKKSDGKKVVFADKDKLTRYFDAEMDTENE